ncbi:hypothetical protein [Nocardioides astragali]|uniref:Uncharacterized protein n=1 Tax=Nocardioides astragali TaxID=1776736 RepID=A0ABW2N1S8_9ACTN|nr:hypothetical protein [Nocardioides astragali]
METEIDWARELDLSFGTGEDVAVEHYVAAGRGAVRRRRLAAVVAGLGAAAVVGGIAWGVAPDRGPSSSDTPVATDPSGTSALSDLRPSGQRDWPAEADDDGLHIRPGAVVHERIDDLFPEKDSESVALDLTYEGKRWWMTLEWGEDGGAGSATTPDEGIYASFDDFVAAEIAGGGMTSRPSSPDDDWFGGLVQWTAGDVRVRSGVEVVTEVRDPLASDLPSVGLVLRKGGVTTWMLVMDGGTGASWTSEADSGWVTFEEWLADQVALQGGTPDDPHEGVSPVKLTEDGTVVPDEPGVVVLEQRADPDLRAYGTHATGAVSAVALLEWKEQRWFVLAVGGPGDGPDAITTVAEVKAGGASTLQEFVAFMADRADEGGMR